MEEKNKSMLAEQERLNAAAIKLLQIQSTVDSKNTAQNDNNGSVDKKEFHQRVDILESTKVQNKPGIQKELPQKKVSLSLY